jgi:hypothetical protein
MGLTGALGVLNDLLRLLCPGMGHSVVKALRAKLGVCGLTCPSDGGRVRFAVGDKSGERDARPK